MKRLEDIPGALDLKSKWSLYRRRYRMGDVLREISQRYGDYARVPIPGARKVLISHPDDIRDVLVTKSQYFGLAGQDLLRRVLQWGLIATEGQLHDEHRAVMLLTLRKILSRRVIAATMLRIRQAMSTLRDGDTIDLYQFAREVSLTIAASLLFPAEAGDEVTSRIDHAAFLNLLSQTDGWYLGMPVPFQKLCLAINLPRTVRMLSVRRRIKDQLTEAVSAARGMKRSGVNADVLSLLTDGSEVGGHIAEEFLHDNLLTILIAGYETTANSLAWALWETSRSAKLQRDIAEEGSKLSEDPMANAEWSNSATWTSASLQESLRMYPSVWCLTRRTLSDFRLGEFLIPKETWVYTSQWVTHRDPRWFPDPLQFRPERWISTNSNAVSVDGASVAAEERPQFSFFPFGGGKRYCIGQAIYDLEASLLLGAFLSHWETTPLPDCNPTPKFHVTMQPDRPMLVRIKRRA